MDHRQENDTEVKGIRFVSAKGSVIGGIKKEKTERITDAMADLQLSIDGLRMQLANEFDSSQWTSAVSSFARTCSIFLRKTVLGNYNRRETRLLDDPVLALTSLRFNRLRNIPRDTRREIEVNLSLSGGFMQVTKRDDHTGEPEATWRFLAGPQEVKLSIEWPLPGVADWTGAPTEEKPWLVSADQLFDTSTNHCMNCDEWLGQQVVLFDGKGISLKELIQTVVNFEGAHSIDVGRLSVVEGEEDFAAAKKPALHILNSITICGIRYAHIIVIECALYLYEKLLDESSIKRPDGDIYTAILGVDLSAEQAKSAQPDWIEFQGNLMISFSGRPSIVQHKIKAVS